MSTTRRVKRGDTMAITVTRTEDGSPVDLSGTSVAAKMRRGSTAITLTAAVTNAAQGIVTLSAAAAATAAWTPGLYACDVEYTAGADVQSSDTFYVEVIEDVTY